MEYNEKLRELRVQSGMSQDDLAEQLHVARQTISKWEQGVNEPDIYTLKQYAAIFNVTIDDIVCDVERVCKPTNKLRNACKTLLFISTVFYAFCVIAVLVLFRFLQNTIPGHYNLTGAIDGYVSKTEVLLHLLPFTFFYAITLFVYKIGDKNLGTPLLNLDNAAFIVIFSIVVALPFGYLAFVLATSVPYLVEHSAPSFIICILGAIELAIALPAHPRITPANNIIGFRTKFTMTNPEAWIKVNRFASVCISVSVVLMIATNMIWISYWAILASSILLFVTLATTFLYHEVLRKKMKI